MKTPKPSESTHFAEVLAIIRTRRVEALASVNVAHLLSRWEIGGYLSSKIKREGWGQATIDRLVDYLHAHAPEERGYGRSNLYNMVSVYEAFTAPDFAELVERYGPRIVQTASGQIAPPEPVPLPVAGIVQMASGQFVPLPPVLALTTFSNLLEIVNRAKSAQERLFYVVYAFRERLNTIDLRKRLVDDAYSAVLGGGKRNYSKALRTTYPAASAIIPDTALVDFLRLPPKHSEARLRKGIVANMKDFILSIGRDFLFMGEEYPVKVGGSDFRIDLLFYHRALRCLVAFELKSREFRPSDMGQLEFYLEALDRDVKRAEENPSIGVLLCKSADHTMVEYALSRTMSPAMVAEYKRVMIPREVLQETFDRYLGTGI